jgi:hypothetical protein
MFHIHTRHWSARGLLQAAVSKSTAGASKQSVQYLLVLGQVEAPVSDVHSMLHALSQSFELVMGHVVVSRDMPYEAVASTSYTLRVSLIRVVLPLFFPCAVLCSVY